MTNYDLNGSQVVVSAAEHESRRFGYSISRVTVPLRADPAAAFDIVSSTISDREPDVVIVRYPTVHVDWFAKLMVSRSRKLIHADTMICFHEQLGLKTLPPERVALPAGMVAQFDRQTDPDRLGPLIDAVFADFPNHYRANPMFLNHLVTAGYREWAERSIRQDRIVVLQGPGDEPSGFITFTAAGGTAERLLGGVSAGTRGRGVFEAIARLTSSIARAAGCSEIVGTTHAHNAATQRVLFNAGSSPRASFTTLHAVKNQLFIASRG